LHVEFRTVKRRPPDDSETHRVLRAAALMLLSTTVRPWDSATQARIGDVLITKTYRLLSDSSALKVGQPTQPLVMIIWGL